MKIVIMSDSHGNDELITKIMKENADASYFLHCGDLCTDVRNFPDVIFVRGNNDYDYDMPTQRFLEFNGLNIGMTHSHHFFGYGKDRLVKLAQWGKENDCDIVAFGHTHCICDETFGGIRLLNPGSLYYNRDGSDIGYYILNVNSKTDYTVRFVKIG